LEWMTRGQESAWTNLVPALESVSLLAWVSVSLLGWVSVPVLGSAWTDLGRA
jgi:hypothetical protein